MSSPATDRRHLLMTGDGFVDWRGTEFAVIERDVLARIREIKGSRRGALTMSPGEAITGVDVETWKEEGPS